MYCQVANAHFVLIGPAEANIVGPAAANRKPQGTHATVVSPATRIWLCVMLDARAYGPTPQYAGCEANAPDQAD